MMGQFGPIIKMEVTEEGTSLFVCYVLQILKRVHIAGLPSVARELYTYFAQFLQSWQLISTL